MSFLVHGAGLFSTFQDDGRPGHAHLGVGRSGAADPAALHLANRIVGNHEHEAAVEVLHGGLEVEALEPHVVAVTGAEAPVHVNGAAQGRGTSLRVGKGERLRIGTSEHGLRCYVSVRGGFTPPAVLGSRSYDQLGDIGPRPLIEGDILTVGRPQGAAYWDPVPLPSLRNEAELRVHPGIRANWLAASGFRQMLRTTWEVAPHVDRTGCRLVGPPLPRRDGELLSEGQLPGAVQVPPDGLPIVLGPDAGVTGGYPVVAVVVKADLGLVGQLRPGSRVRLLEQR